MQKLTHNVKRHILSLLILCSLTTLAQPKYEVRAVWLTTIGGIDWPSRYAHDGMGIERQKQELTNMLDRLQAININTVLLQTRVRATTIYPSDLEPWDGCLSGRPGQSPGYDALQFAIDECHRRGMELHAWIVTIPIGKWNSYGCQQLRRRYPSLVKRIGEEGYMNPESYQTADYLARICAEVTSRYDVDGIHLDYIRYPETWRGSKRSDNITHIVETVSHEVKRLKPWIKMSCSPIGKYDDLSRYSSRGWNARRQVAQDAQGWLREGLMDQLYPMMYFQGNNFYPFAIDWQEQSSGRMVISGLGTYMLHPRERNWPLAEVQRQLNVTRQIGVGHCHFRAKFLLDNVKGIYDYMTLFDRHPSLIPPMTWAQSIAPDAPTTLSVERTAEGDQLAWSGANDRSDGPYLLYNVYASTETPVDISNAKNLIATRCAFNHLSIHRQAGRPPLYYAVTAMDRYGNESMPVREVSDKPVMAVVPMLLIQNNGETLNVPDSHQLDARLLTISDMQGRVVHTLVNQPIIHISSLPEGMYQLRAMYKKGKTHRLGCFIIKRKQ